MLQLVNDVMTLCSNVYFINIIKKNSFQPIFAYNFDQKITGTMSTFYKSSWKSLTNLRKMRLKLKNSNSGKLYLVTVKYYVKTHVKS